MDADFFASWMRVVVRLVEENVEHLTQLDRAIGDGDHGSNLRRGLVAALGALDEKAPATPAAVLTAAGRALISKTGGASGPLYGGAFRSAGKALGSSDVVDARQLGEALRGALTSVQQLGSAQEGDKTMVDALAPAVAAYEKAVDGGAGVAAAAQSAAEAAERGAQATEPLQARKGRASYLGERSVGHRDPGAASTTLVFRALSDVAGGEASEVTP